MVTIVPNGRLRASAMEIVFGSGGAETNGPVMVGMSSVMIVSICNMVISPYLVKTSDGPTVDVSEAIGRTLHTMRTGEQLNTGRRFVGEVQPACDWAR